MRLTSYVSILQAEDEGDAGEDSDGVESDKEDHEDDPSADVDSDVKVRMVYINKIVLTMLFLKN